MKAHTCKHNTNRHAHKIVNPYCNYGIDIKLPPHMFVQVRSSITEATCRICKCYEKEPKK